MGKIVGTLLGLTVGGPWGACVGLVIGHMHDKQELAVPETLTALWNSYSDYAIHSELATFTMGVVVLSAKMAKSDGRVTRAEIEAFKRVFRIAPEQEDAIGRMFDQARLSARGFEPYAFQLARAFRNKPAVLEEILSGLFIIGAADSAVLGQSETAFLKSVAIIFGFSAEDFARIAARAGVGLHGQEKPRDQAPEAFAILGISEAATAQQIKSAYYTLIREHHPDRLIAQGMPPEFVATATEKMKRINAAYDAVCKIKGIK
ncbi:MAG: TerB family tellurite resistance protein [Alphaproteobacteria bacterium]|nr:TerB family tellurite resistance protein [Alphaproteobacteria bacterium]